MHNMYNVVDAICTVVMGETKSSNMYNGRYGDSIQKKMSHQLYMITLTHL